MVAAITLPSLTGNINERTWNTQRKALYARFSQALPLMDALNGYGTFTAATGSASAVDNCAETFVTAGLAKVLKINNICSDKLEDCGVPSKINPLGGGSAFETPTGFEALNDSLRNVTKTKAAAFETQNGESIVVYYNPTCVGNLDEKPFTQESHANGVFVHKRVCANFIYDLNGTKGPNTVGKDIGFMTVMYPFDAQLYAPYPAVKPLASMYAVRPANNSTSASKACTDYDSEYRLPRVDELLAMFINKKLISASTYTENTFGYASSDYYVGYDGSKFVAGHTLGHGLMDDLPLTSALSVWCVKR